MSRFCVTDLVALVSVIMPIYSTWFSWPGKSKNTYTQSLRHTYKKIKATDENINPIKNISQPYDFQSNARCLHFRLCQKPHTFHLLPHFEFTVYGWFHLCLCPPPTPYALLSEPPSAPQQLISVVNETSVVLEWTPPHRLGGRSDTSYSLECLICQTGSHSHTGGRAIPRNRSISQPEAQHSGLGMQSDQGIVGPEASHLGRGVFQSRPGDFPRPGSGGGSVSSSQFCAPCGSDVLFSPGQTSLTTTRVVVSELRAHTHYTFIVHARNGVSQASGAGAAQSVSVSVTTNQAGEKEKCLFVINLFVRLLTVTQNLLIDVVRKWVSRIQAATQCVRRSTGSSVAWVKLKTVDCTSRYAHALHVGILHLCVLKVASAVSTLKL